MTAIATRLGAVYQAGQTVKDAVLTARDAAASAHEMVDRLTEARKRDTTAMVGALVRRARGHADPENAGGPVRKLNGLATTLLGITNGLQRIHQSIDGNVNNMMQMESIAGTTKDDLVDAFQDLENLCSQHFSTLLAIEQAAEKLPAQFEEVHSRWAPTKNIAQYLEPLVPAIRDAKVTLNGKGGPLASAARAGRQEAERLP